MARFFFDLHDEFDAIDDEGKDLPDVHAAKDVALREAREMIMAEVARGELDLCHRIEVRDEQGRVVHVIHFADAVSIAFAGKAVNAGVSAVGWDLSA